MDEDLLRELRYNQLWDVISIFKIKKNAGWEGIVGVMLLSLE